MMAHEIVPFAEIALRLGAYRGYKVRRLQSYAKHLSRLACAEPVVGGLSPTSLSTSEYPTTHPFTLATNSLGTVRTCRPPRGPELRSRIRRS